MDYKKYKEKVNNQTKEYKEKLNKRLKNYKEKLNKKLENFKLRLKNKSKSKRKLKGGFNYDTIPFDILILLFYHYRTYLSSNGVLTSNTRITILNEYKVELDDIVLKFQYMSMTHKYLDISNFISSCDIFTLTDYIKNKLRSSSYPNNSVDVIFIYNKSEKKITLNDITDKFEIIKKYFGNSNMGELNELIKDRNDFINENFLELIYDDSNYISKYAKLNPKTNIEIFRMYIFQTLNLLNTMNMTREYHNFIIPIKILENYNDILYDTDFFKVLNDDDYIKKLDIRSVDFTYFLSYDIISYFKKLFRIKDNDIMIYDKFTYYIFKTYLSIFKKVLLLLCELKNEYCDSDNNYVLLTQDIYIYI